MNTRGVTPPVWLVILVWLVVLWAVVPALDHALAPYPRPEVVR